MSIFLSYLPKFAMFPPAFCSLPLARRLVGVSIVVAITRRFDAMVSRSTRGLWLVAVLYALASYRLADPSDAFSTLAAKQRTAKSPSEADIAALESSWSPASRVLSMRQLTGTWLLSSPKENAPKGLMSGDIPRMLLNLYAGDIGRTELSCFQSWQVMVVGKMLSMELVTEPKLLIAPDGRTDTQTRLRWGRQEDDITLQGSLELIAPNVLREERRFFTLMVEGCDLDVGDVGYGGLVLCRYTSQAALPFLIPHKENKFGRQKPKLTRSKALKLTWPAMQKPRVMNITYFDGNLLIVRDARGIVDVLRREENEQFFSGKTGGEEEPLRKLPQTPAGPSVSPPPQSGPVVPVKPKKAATPSEQVHGLLEEVQSLSSSLEAPRPFTVFLR
eukprot:s194_g18.t1